MFLAEPPNTAYDLRFRLGGIPVRVTPFFWVAAALIGWDLAAGLDEFMREIAQRDVPPEVARIAESNPGQGLLLLLWIVAVFVSILIHELGHALVMRYYGIGSRIVLYHFGGLAIPEGAGSFIRFGGYSRSGQQIAISAAGPGAQFLLAAVLIVALQLSGSAILFEVPYLEFLVSLSDDRQRQIPSLPIQAAFYFLLIPSIFWALLNLLPVYPLDGGQISRELFTLFNPRDGIRYSLILSVVAGTSVAVYAFMGGDIFLAILFGMLAYSSYQILQAYSGRGGGFGSPW